MAQTVQINRRSSREGSLHYSGSDEYGSRSPGPLKTTLHRVPKLLARLGSLSPIRKLLERHLNPINPWSYSHSSWAVLVSPVKSNKDVSPGIQLPIHPSAFKPSLPYLAITCWFWATITLNTSRAGHGSSYLVSHHVTPSPTRSWSSPVC